MSRVALVTGASRGIGHAIATRLAKEGHAVALVARSADALEAAAAHVRSQGANATVHVCDVTDRAASEATIDDVLARHGRLDVLVNNAATNVRAAVTDLPVETWDRILALTLTAPFHWSQRCHAALVASEYGRVVNIGSVAGMRALPTGAAYGAAKAGLAQLTRILAREWGHEGVTVNCIAPWYVPTPLTEGVLADESFRDAVLRCTPTGRLGTAEEVAAAVAFLAGEEAGWISGVVLPMDGGFTASAFFPA